MTTANGAVLACCANCEWVGECPAVAICPGCGLRQVRRYECQENGGGGRGGIGSNALVAASTSTRLSARVALLLIGNAPRWEWAAWTQAPDQSSPRYLRGGTAETFPKARAAVLDAFKDAVGGDYALVWSCVDEQNQVTAKGSVST